MTPTDDFAVFYDSVFARLVGQLRIVTGELQDAEDVVQETLARASMRWTWLRAYDAPEAWVRRVGVGPAPPEPTAAGRAAPARPTGAHAGGAGRGPGAAGGAAGPVGWQRQVLVLHYRVAMPVQEVARTLGVPSGTVKVRLARGRSALAAQLGDQQRRSDLGMTELEERLRRFAEEGARQAHPGGWRRRSDVAGFAAAAWSERSAWRW